MESLAVSQCKSPSTTPRRYENFDYQRFEHVRVARLDLGESRHGGQQVLSALEAEQLGALRRHCEIFDEEGQAFVLDIGEFLHKAKEIHHLMPHLLRHAERAKEMDYDLLIVHF